MSISVTKQVWKYSKATGNKRLVLLALADFATEEKVIRGEPALVWPSQQTIADMCGCSRSTVELAVEWLTKAGEIVPTGNRRWGKYKGTVEYEVLPDMDLLADELTENESTENRSTIKGEEVDLTDSRNDLTDSGEPPDRFSPLADRPIGHNPVVNPVVNPEVKQGPSPSAHDSPSTDLPPNSENNSKDPSLVAAQATQSERTQQEQALADLREQLPTTSHRDQTERAIARLEAELDDPELVAA